MENEDVARGNISLGPEMASSGGMGMGGGSGSSFGMGGMSPYCI